MAALHERTAHPGDTVIVGRVRDHAGAWVPGQVWIAGDSIAEVRYVRTDPDELTGVRAIDAGDGFVLPGAVDAHVHSLSHEGEGIAASTRSAAAGGVTTVVEMPFDNTAAPTGGAINTRDRLLAKQDLVAREAHVDVALLGTLAPHSNHDLEVSRHDQLH